MGGDVGDGGISPIWSKPRAVGFAIRSAVRVVVMDGGLTLLA